MDRDDRTLRDILEEQPGGESGDRRHSPSWWRQNWMAVAMFVCWAFMQIWSGTDWLHARENNEGATAREVADLRRELQAMPNTYVRQDVFTQVLININTRLSSIDDHLKGRR